MEQKKPWYLSKTIWGVLIGVAGFALSKFGVSEPVLPSSPDFDSLKGFVEAFKAAKGSVEAYIAIGMQVVGFALALYGRIKADAKIS
jgi:hypothetical protein